MKPALIFSFFAMLLLLNIYMIAYPPHVEPDPIRYPTYTYNLNSYNIAGTEDYQYVISFVFYCERELQVFLRKYHKGELYAQPQD